MRLPKKFEGYIKAQLRRIWGWYPERKKARETAYVGIGAYECASCRGKHPKGSTQIDHVVPVESVDGFDGDWNAWIARLFVGVEGLQVLCSSCHKAKSESENAKRPHRNKKRKAP